MLSPTCTKVIKSRNPRDGWRENKRNFTTNDSRRNSERENARAVRVILSYFCHKRVT